MQDNQQSACESLCAMIVLYGRAISQAMHGQIHCWMHRHIVINIDRQAGRNSSVSLKRHSLTLFKAVQHQALCEYTDDHQHTSKARQAQKNSFDGSSSTLSYWELTLLKLCNELLHQLALLLQ